MTEEEKKQQRKQWEATYAAKDPERRKQQKREAAKRYYQKNKEKCREKTKECDRKRKERDPELFREKANANAAAARRRAGMQERLPKTPEQIEEQNQRNREAHLQWKAENKELFKEIQRESSRRYRQENPEKCRETKRKWKEKNPEKVKEINLRAKHRRRQKLENQSEVDIDKWKETLAGFDYKCAYCRSEATCMDHIVPVAHGGTNHHTNLLPACTRCNSSKGAKPLHVWLLKSKIATVGLNNPW